MSRIIFIANNIASSHVHKRIQEFIDQGYEIEVYGCQRTGIAITHEYPYKIHVFGTFGQQRYLKRLGILLKAVRKILAATRPDDVYFCFGLDNALAVYLQTHRRYIYEEADLQHTYIRKKPIVKLLEWMDKRIIKRSLLTLLTSDGYLQYHYGGKCPANAAMVYNKLDASILDMPVVPKRPLDIQHLKIAFVGGLRGKSVYNFAKVIGEHFPQHEIHFYGYVNKLEEQMYGQLKQYPNVIFHGRFQNPVDLPRIYSEIDIVYATYDVIYDNIRYAEPNKLYEAVYFETPFIVSSHTYLAERVQRLGIGFDVDAMNDEEVCHLINGLTEEAIQDKVRHAAAIDKKTTINENSAFFAKLKSLLA